MSSFVAAIAEHLESFEFAGGEPSRQGADEIWCLDMEQPVEMARVAPN